MRADYRAGYKKYAGHTGKHYDASDSHLPYCNITPQFARLFSGQFISGQDTIRPCICRDSHMYLRSFSYPREEKKVVMTFVTARTMGVAAIRLPSEDIFSSELKVTTFFGSPLSVSSGGLAIDVKRVITLVKALDADTSTPIQFLSESGMNSSALEHSVPEQLWSTTANPAYAVSAVKALQLANDQGMPIYTINQSNINAILPQLQHDGGTISDIQNAVNAGKEVTVSKADVTFNGWTGCGYIIVDPVTGAGAYMISGGMNGGLLMYKWAWAFLFFAYLNLASCMMGMIVMCAFAAGFAVVAMAYMNVAMCMLTSVNYRPDGLMNELLFGASQPIFFAAANAIMIAAFKRVPGGSTMQNIARVSAVAKMTDIIAFLLNITCSKAR